MSENVSLYFLPTEFKDLLTEFCDLVREKKYKKLEYGLWCKFSHDAPFNTDPWSVCILPHDNLITIKHAFDNNDKEEAYCLPVKDNSFGEYLYDKFGKTKRMTISTVEELKIEPLNKTKAEPIALTTSGLIIKDKAANTDSIASTTTTTTTTDTITTIAPTLTLDYKDLDKYFSDSVEKWNEDRKMKENEKMKGFNFDFGPCTDNNVRMSMYGLAVKNAAGTWVSYNSNSKEIIDVDIFNFDGAKFFYKIPVAIKDIAVGDIVIHNRKPMIVLAVLEDALNVVDPQAGERKEIMLTKSPFGFNFATKVVSLFNFTGGDTTATADAPFGNMLPFLFMSSDSTDFDPMLMFMMMQQTGAASTNAFGNPMMMYFLMKDDKKSDELLPLMLLMNQNK